MPRRIADRATEERGATGIAEPWPAPVQFEHDLWDVLYPNEPLPDFDARAREWRQQHPPGEPMDFTTPEGRRALAKLRADDDAMRLSSLQRNEEPK